MNEITPTASVSIIRTYDDAERAARAMAASGFFADSRQASQAVVKIMAGQELGFGPFASMTGVHIIQNKPVLAANLMAAAVKRTNKYNYRILRLDDTGCEIAFLEGGQEVGKSKFDQEDAKKAGLLSRDNWAKYPRNMYFARALSNGQKWYAPDVFNGAIVYTPDELGAPVDEEGNALSIQTQEAVKPDDVEKEFPKTDVQPITVKGLKITPQDVLDNGLAKNIHSASQMVNGLLLVNKPLEEGLEICKLYRRWRDAGLVAKDAAVKTLAKEEPPAEKE